MVEHTFPLNNARCPLHRAFFVKDLRHGAKEPVSVDFLPRTPCTN
jgi:hypothetical protein